MAVHWPPAVYVWTPGWMVADDAGAQADAGAEGMKAAPRARTAAVASMVRTRRGFCGRVEGEV